MTCLICGEPAAVVDTDGDYEERACSNCGHYRVMGTALVLMKAHGWYFDEVLTRK
jgi:transcription elongation factor Elf1